MKERQAVFFFQSLYKKTFCQNTLFSDDFVCSLAIVSFFSLPLRLQGRKDLSFEFFSKAFGTPLTFLANDTTAFATLFLWFC